MKRWFALCAFIGIFAFSSADGASIPKLSITGVVRSPLQFTLDELRSFQSLQVQLNEVMEDGSYRGVFHYRGVPLRVLLEAACVEKEDTDFSKHVDLAVRIRNREGKVVALSWGEVFYRNPGRILIATSAQPIMPHKDCRACHTPEEYTQRLKQLSRRIGFPKLVAAGDEYADRSLERIVSIEVVDLGPPDRGKKGKGELFSPKFTVTGSVEQTLSVSELSGYSRKTIRARHLGEGKGYHGLNLIEGVSFRRILEEAGMPADLNQVFIVSAPDGYRSLFSYGEVFLDPLGERILMADRIDGQPIEKGGRFFLVPPDDLMSDRDVKAVEKIEILSLTPEPKLYVIGVGCGDTNLITLEAISAMARADVFICPPDIEKRFSKYMGGKPVLLDIYEFVPPVLEKKYPEFSQKEREALMMEKQAESVAAVEAKINEGLSVAILDYGDPTIWSGWSWAMGRFNDEVLEIVPGLSSFNAANAVLERRIDCNGSIVLSTTRGILGNGQLLASLAEQGETLCVFMGIQDLRQLVPLLKQHYSEETPACLVYRAGYGQSEDVIYTTLEDLEKAARGHPEKYLGLIYVGPCLQEQSSTDCG